MSLTTLPSSHLGDKRCQRSRLAFREAFISELERHEDLHAITVSSLSRRSGLTRRTFYAHYRDIPDFVEQLCCELLADLEPLLHAIAANDLLDVGQALLCCKPVPGVIELLNYMKDQGSYLRILCGERGAPSLIARIKELGKRCFEERLRHGLDQRIPQELVDYYLQYVVCAQLGVLLHWLHEDMKTPVDQMAGIMTTLLYTRPGDLYGHSVELNVAKFALDILHKEKQ